MEVRWYKLYGQFLKFLLHGLSEFQKIVVHVQRLLTSSFLDVLHSRIPQMVFVISNHILFLSASPSVRSRAPESEWLTVHNFC